MASRVRIEQQLVRIKAVTGRGIVRTVHAVAIDRARPNAVHITVPDLIGVFGQLDARVLAGSGFVEEAKLDAGRMR